VRNISEKYCRENQNAHFIFNNFFPPENGAEYDTVWKNMVEPDRPQVTTFALHSEYVILIASPQQQWFR
jgi:hypothetical protein